MVNFRQMEQQMQNTARIIGILDDKKTHDDAEIMGICFSEIEGLRKAKKELKPLIDSLENYNERMIMALRYLKGYDFYWIADHLSITERTVFRYLKRAKIKLSEMYPDRIENK